jgi:thiosulfate dehydrogenase
MNKHIHGAHAAFVRVLLGVFAGLLCAGAAHAREPYTEAELAAQEAKLLAMVDRGRDLWHGSRADMSNNGLGCGNCHPDAAASNPQTFPKYMPMFNKVVPFREMVNWCIQNPQGGKALDVNSDDMTAMEAYAFYLYRGEKIEPGLATRQTTSVPVRSGVGFPKKPSGIGVDR